MRTIRDLTFMCHPGDAEAPQLGEQVKVYHWRTHPNDQRDAAVRLEYLEAFALEYGAQFGGDATVTVVQWIEGRSGKMYPRVDVQLHAPRPGPPKLYPHRLQLRYSDIEREAIASLTADGEDAQNLIRRLLREEAARRQQ